MMMRNINDQTTKTRPNGTTLGWLTLFTSTGTLICCALPILFVSLGFGASVAAITSSFPLIITLSQYKIWIFIISGSLLIVSAWAIKRTKSQCPVNTELGELCHRAKIFNRRIWQFAVLIWLIGFIAAYLALPVQKWLEL